MTCKVTITKVTEECCFNVCMTINLVNLVKLNPLGIFSCFHLPLLWRYFVFNLPYPCQPPWCIWWSWLPALCPRSSQLLCTQCQSVPSPPPREVCTVCQTSRQAQSLHPAGQRLFHDLQGNYVLYRISNTSRSHMTIIRRVQGHSVVMLKVMII